QRNCDLLERSGKENCGYAKQDRPAGGPVWGRAVAVTVLAVGAEALPARERGIGGFLARAAAPPTLAIAAIAARRRIGSPRAIPAAMVAMPVAHGFQVLGISALERQGRRWLPRARRPGIKRDGTCGGAQESGAQHRPCHWVLRGQLLQR